VTETLRGSSVVRALVAKHAYTRRTEPFKLSSGVLSYDYVDAKQILLVNEHQAVVGAAIANVIKELGLTYDSVGGLELGAIYVAQALLLHEWSQNRQAVNSFVVRKQPKSHGKGLQIEGPSVSGESVIIVDDVVTTGDSILRAVDAVQAEGGRVQLAVTLVDRGTSAASKLEVRGVRYHPLTTFEDYGIDPVPDNVS